MKTGMYDLVFAEEMILERCTALDTEQLAVANAAGRILAQDITEADAAQDQNAGQACPGTDRIVAKQGCMIGPALHGTLIGLGIHQVEVYRKPLIGFYYLEGEEPSGSGIQKKSNRYILGNALREFGFSTIYQGCIPQERAQTVSTVRMASAVYDAVFVCGGSEPDDFARVQDMLEKTGAEIVADHIDIQPGATVCTGFMEHVPVFGIAGTSEELLTAFYLIVLPVLKKIAGRKEEAHERIMVELSRNFDECNEVTRILPGHLVFADGIVRMLPRDSAAEDHLRHARDVDACVVIPAGMEPLKKGTLLNAYRIRS